MQLDEHPNVVVATVGDAASRQGEFYEAIAFAIERQLPIVFIVEDNNYGISTNTEKFNPFKLEVFNEDHLVHVDARHPDRVFDVAAPWPLRKLALAEAQRLSLQNSIAFARILVPMTTESIVRSMRLRQWQTAIRSLCCLMN